MSIIITIGNFGTLRFGNIPKRIERITAKTLADRLQELKQEGIVQRLPAKNCLLELGIH